MSVVMLLDFVRTRYRDKLTVSHKRVEKTLATYLRVLEALQRFWQARTGVDLPMPLAALDNDLVTAYLAALTESGHSAATVDTHRAVIIAVWNFARRYRFRELGLTDAPPPDIDRVRADLDDPQCWSVDEIGRLLTIAAAEEGWVGQVRAGQWWPALLLTFYDTGLRCNAVMQLPAAALDLSSGWLRVSAATQKQHRGQSFELDGQTLDALRLIDPGHHERLFPWPWDRVAKGERAGQWNGEWKTLRQQLKRMLVAAGLVDRGQNTRKDLFHRIRRTTGTLVTANGSEAAAVKHLGHSSASVTRRYQDPRFLPSDSAVHVLPRPEYQRQLQLFAG